MNRLSVDLLVHRTLPGPGLSALRIELRALLTALRIKENDAKCRVERHLDELLIALPRDSRTMKLRDFINNH